MWSRTELKDKAKVALKRNYWKLVLVSLIAMLVGGAAGSSSFSSDFSSGFESGFESSSGLDDYYEDDYYEDDYNGEEGSMTDDFFGEFGVDAAEVATFVIVFVIVFLVVFVIAMVISFVIQAFVLNPLDVGTKRFFVNSLADAAPVKDVIYAYENNYMNVVKTLFFRDLYITLWSFLFIIPGVIKKYEYRMMPYLLAENPSLSKEEAFALSKKMMDGQKWDAFVLDLSFIGWDFLSGLTAGILGIFYVNPYKNMTCAALYDKLSDCKPWSADENVPDYYAQLEETAEEVVVEAYNTDEE